MKSVLNVGGGSKKIPIPEKYDGWRHVMLDIDDRFGADIIMDARLLHTLPGGEYDAVLCSHTLEHFYRHDGLSVLRGIHHVLKPEGFLEVRVPDARAALKRYVELDKDDLDVVLYRAGGIGITMRHVLYGYPKEVERSGTDAFAHKNAFGVQSLRSILAEAGFPFTGILGNQGTDFEIEAYAFKQPFDAPAILRLLTGKDATSDGSSGDVAGQS